MSFDTTQITSPGNYSQPDYGKPCHSLASGAHVPSVAMALTANDNGRDATENTCPTVRVGAQPAVVPDKSYAMNAKSFYQNPTVETYIPFNEQAGTLGGASQSGGFRTTDLDNSGAFVQAFAMRGRDGENMPEVHGDGQTTSPVRTEGGSGRDYVGLLNQIRRLTPLECERLQGLPDNHTRVPFKGKDASMCPDTPRYKAVGNGFAVPVVRWLGERIQMFERLVAQGKIRR